MVLVVFLPLVSSSQVPRCLPERTRYAASEVLARNPKLQNTVVGDPNPQQLVSARRLSRA